MSDMSKEKKEEMKNKENDNIGEVPADNGDVTGEGTGFFDKKDKKSVKLLEKQLEISKKENEKLAKEKEELNDTYLRMMAEYDNFRKRVLKEKETMYSDGIAEAVEKLLPVLDNLERAATSGGAGTDSAAVVEGVKKILDQATEIFSKLGVREIAAKGEKFNPELHNAVMHEDNEEYDENTISDVFLKGYKIGDKVIRHSVVKVMN